MKQLSKFLMVAVLLLMGLPVNTLAKTTTKVKVTEPVSVTEDVDYVISGATPFDGDGVVDLVNTEHAVLIVQQLKPSEMLKILSTRVKINGKTFTNKSQIKDLTKAGYEASKYSKGTNVKVNGYVFGGS